MSIVARLLLVVFFSGVIGLRPSAVASGSGYSPLWALMRGGTASDMDSNTARIIYPLSQLESLPRLLEDLPAPAVFPWEQSYYLWLSGTLHRLDTDRVDGWLVSRGGETIVTWSNAGELVLLDTDAGTTIARVPLDSWIEAASETAIPGQILLEAYGESASAGGGGKTLVFLELGTGRFETLTVSAYSEVQLNDEGTTLTIDGAFYELGPLPMSGWTKTSRGTAPPVSTSSKWKHLSEESIARNLVAFRFPAVRPESTFWKPDTEGQNEKATTGGLTIAPVAPNRYKLNRLDASALRQIADANGSFFIEIEGREGRTGLDAAVSVYRGEPFAEALVERGLRVNYDYSFSFALLKAAENLYVVSSASEGVQYGSASIVRITKGKDLEGTTLQLHGDSLGIVGSSSDGRYLIVSDFAFADNEAFYFLRLSDFAVFDVPIAPKGWGPDASTYTFSPDGKYVFLRSENQEIWKYKIDDPPARLVLEARIALAGLMEILFDTISESERIADGERPELVDQTVLIEDNIMLISIKKHGLFCLNLETGIPRWRLTHRDLWSKEASETQGLHLGAHGKVLAVWSHDELRLVDQGSGQLISNTMLFSEGQRDGSTIANAIVDDAGAVSVLFPTQQWRRDAPMARPTTREINRALVQRAALKKEEKGLHRVNDLRTCLGVVNP